MSGGVAVDFSALSKAGTSLAAGLEQNRLSGIAQAMGAKVQAGDYAGAASDAFAAGDLQTGLSLVKLGESKAQTADFQKSFGGGGLAGLMGGGTTPATGTPAPVAPGNPVRAASSQADSALAAFKTNDPVAADLRPEQKALLNAIAGGESGGKYNVRYTPRGGQLFELNGQHPGIAEAGPAGPSTAAGRYQFTKTTWDRLGGGNFSPENQDRRALLLAEQDYRSRTGRDLNADLAKEGFSPRIQKALSPTWAALAGNVGRHSATYAESLQRYGGASGRTQVASADPSFMPGTPSAAVGASPAAPTRQTGGASFGLNGPVGQVFGGDASPIPPEADPVPAEQRVQVAQAVPQVLAQAGMKPAAVAQVQQMAPGSPERINYLVKAMSHPAAPEGFKDAAKAILANELQISRLSEEQQAYQADVAQGFRGSTMDWRAAKARATAAPEKDKQEDIVKARANWQRLGLPDPSQPANAKFWQDYAAKALGGGGPLVTVDTGQKAETTESVGLATARLADAKRYKEDGEVAQGKAVDFAQLREIGRRVGEVGAEAGFKEAIGPYATAAGIRIEGLGDIQAYSGILAKMIPLLKPPGSGPQTDADAKNIQKALPGLIQIPQSRELLLDMMESANDVAIQRGRIAEAYTAGNIDRAEYGRQLLALPKPIEMFRKFRDDNPTVLKQAEDLAKNPGRPLPREGQAGALKPMNDAQKSRARELIRENPGDTESILATARRNGFDPSGL